MDPSATALVLSYLSALIARWDRSSRGSDPTVSIATAYHQMRSQFLSYLSALIARCDRSSRGSDPTVSIATPHHQIRSHNLRTDHDPRTDPRADPGISYMESGPSRRVRIGLRSSKAYIIQYKTCRNKAIRNNLDANCEVMKSQGCNLISFKAAWCWPA